MLITVLIISLALNLFFAFARYKRQIDERRIDTLAKRAKLICLDFDGVIHSYKSGWIAPDVIPDPPVPGAIEFLLEYLPKPHLIPGSENSYMYTYAENGPQVVIYSSRSRYPEGRKAMKSYLVKHGVPKCLIDDYMLLFPTKKPPAFLTIDDRAIQFNGTFPKPYEIMNFKPWNRKPTKVKKKSKRAMSFEEAKALQKSAIEAKKKGQLLPTNTLVIVKEADEVFSALDHGFITKGIGKDNMWYEVKKAGEERRGVVHVSKLVVPEHVTNFIQQD